MSHVQYAGNIGGRDDNGICPAPVRETIEIMFLVPVSVPSGFCAGGIIMFTQFHPGASFLKECKVNQSLRRMEGLTGNKKVSVELETFLLGEGI
jgi:hypothetical protein